MVPETLSASGALSANTLTLAGYSFVGWNTAANGSGTAYADGASYAFGANLTLYAQWVLGSYVVTFNPNGASGSMSLETSSVPAALSANTLTFTGYVFAGWNTAANGSGTAYADGASYAFGANLTLYAQWVAHVAPNITQNPSSAIALGGTVATFNAAATGAPTPSVQWRVSTDGVSWVTIAGATATTYSVTAASSNNGAYYDAVFTNSVGSVTSSSAQLTYMEASTNWSGYVDTAGTFSGVSAQWVVPAVSCSSATSQIAVQWVGIDGYGSSSVEQDGTQTSCNGTTPAYGAWYEMYGDASINNGQMVMLSATTYPISPGDLMSASVNYSGAAWVLSIANVTQAWTFSVDVASPTPPPAQASAEWIVETPTVCTSGCALASLANFATATFTNASVTTSAATGSITSTTYVAVEARGTSADVLMYPSELYSTGTSFTVTWQASS